MSDPERTKRTKEWLEKFERNADELEEAGPRDLNPVLHKAQIESLRSMAQDLRSQLQADDPLESEQ